jgi:hypothetical protein
VYRSGEDMTAAGPIRPQRLIVNDRSDAMTCHTTIAKKFSTNE